LMVWDRGIWVPKGDPKAGYAKGHLKFELDGEKLRGRWNLVRTHSKTYGDKSWLLIKEADEFARLARDEQIAEDRPNSVLSGRTMTEVAADKDRVWHSNRSAAANVRSGAIAKTSAKVFPGLARIKGVRKAAMPKKIEPQLATLAAAPPNGKGWVQEIKYDGYRMLSRIADGEARMISRNEKDWTEEFGALARVMARLPVESAWLDGEVIAADEKGRSSFQRLQNALSAESSEKLSYVAFDLLYLNGFDLRGAALTERKRLLQKLLADAPGAIKYSEHFAVPGAAFLDNVAKLGLEGMVSKRADQPYRAGRGPAWMKVRCEKRQEMVIGGFTDPEGSRHGFGALLLGVYERDGRLAYSGRVGTGFDDATLASLARTLAPLERKESPFHNPPTGSDARGVHWVKPELVAEVSFTEWTDDGTLRHPSFEALREDKPAKKVVRETPPNDRKSPAKHTATRSDPQMSRRAAAGAHIVQGVQLSNPDKLLYPEAKLSKEKLANYYAAVGEWMLPHLHDRPLTLVRCPNGWDKPCFYQKNADDSVSETIARVKIPGSDGGSSTYMMANSVSAIIALVQMGVLEIHPWGSRAKHLGKPDRLIFDFDPEDSVTWKEVKDAVLVLKTLLEKIGLAPFLKTTGGKGLHVVVPIRPTVGWEDAKGFTKAVAELLERTFPDRFTAKMLKISRKRRIFVDYLRNAEGATAVGAYSTRARANAPVSMPIGWDELSRDVRYDYFNVANVPKRLQKLKRDPWRDIEKSAMTLDKAIMSKVGYKQG
jgi:bifunctional non-homologous end joining protein LigD